MKKQYAKDNLKLTEQTKLARKRRQKSFQWRRWQMEQKTWDCFCKIEQRVHKHRETDTEIIKLVYSAISCCFCQELHPHPHTQTTQHVLSVRLGVKGTKRDLSYPPWTQPEKYYKVLHLPDGGDGRYRKKSLRPRSSDASSHRGAELEVKLRLFQSTGRHYKPLPEEGQFSWVCTGKGKRREMEDRGRANLDMFCKLWSIT